MSYYLLSIHVKKNFRLYLDYSRMEPQRREDAKKLKRNRRGAEALRKLKNLSVFASLRFMNYSGSTLLSSNDVFLLTFLQDSYAISPFNCDVMTD